ncbi:MAG: hypothetical protein D6739_04075, partial [Nitrospirae bacterium]
MPAGALFLALLVATGVTSLVRGGAEVPTATMSAGQVLRQGNRPESLGLGASFSLVGKMLERQLASAARPDHYHTLARRMLACQGDEGWRGPPSHLAAVLAYLRDAPGAHLALLGRKLLFGLGPVEAWDVPGVAKAQRAMGVWPMQSGLLLPLGLMGLLLAALWGEGRLARRLLGMVAATLFVLVTFYVSSRYRAPLLAWAAAGVGLGAAALARRERRGRVAALAVLALAALLLFAASVNPWNGRIEAVRARGQVATELFEAHTRALRAGDEAEAFRLAAAAVAASPTLLWTRPVPHRFLAADAFWAAVVEAAARAREDPLGAFV